MSPLPSPENETPEIVPEDHPGDGPASRSYWRRLRRAVAVLLAAIAAHVWLVRAPQPPRQHPRPLEMAAGLPTTAPAVAREVQVTAGVDAIPIGSPIGTTGQHPVAALGTAVGRSFAASRAVVAPIRVAKTRLSADTIAEREPAPAPARPRVADTPQAEHAHVDTVQVKSLELRSDKPLILAGLPSGVAASKLPTRAVTESSTSEPARDIQEQTKIIEELLNRYTRSFETMDPRATKAVYPAVDDRALQKAYRALDGQQVRLSSCGVSIDGSDANARCRGNATYRPKVGASVHLTDLEWMFSLARGDAGWQIVNANARIR